MNDTFPHLGRWDTVGLDCSVCVHFSGPATWPDSARTSHCRHHGVSLEVELAENGYKEGEWFCSEYLDNGATVAAAAKHLAHVRPNLSPLILYCFVKLGGPLKEVSIRSLPMATAGGPSGSAA